MIIYFPGFTSENKKLSWSRKYQLLKNKQTKNPISNAPLIFFFYSKELYSQSNENIPKLNRL